MLRLSSRYSQHYLQRGNAMRPLATSAVAICSVGCDWSDTAAVMITSSQWGGAVIYGWGFRAPYFKVISKILVTDFSNFFVTEQNIIRWAYCHLSPNPCCVPSAYTDSKRGSWWPGEVSQELSTSAHKILLCCCSVYCLQQCLLRSTVIVSVVVVIWFY